LKIVDGTKVSPARGGAKYKKADLWKLRFEIVRKPFRFLKPGRVWA
jgi:hypothetical protein